MGNRMTKRSATHGSAAYESHATSAANLPVDEVDECRAKVVTRASKGSTASQSGNETDLQLWSENAQLRSENVALLQKLKDEKIQMQGLVQEVTHLAQQLVDRPQRSEKTVSDLNKDCLIAIAKRLDDLGPFFNRADARSGSACLSTYHDLTTTVYNCEDKVALANALVGTDLDGIIFGEPGALFWKKLKFTSGASKGGVDLGHLLSLLKNRVHCFVEELDLSMECGAYMHRLAEKKKYHRRVSDVLRADGFGEYCARKLLKRLRSTPDMLKLKGLRLRNAVGSTGSPVQPYLSQISYLADVLGAIVAKVPQLRSLDLDCDSIDDEVLHLITNSLPHLEHASFNHLDDDVQDENLQAFLNSKPLLTSFEPFFFSVSSSLLCGWLQPGSETAARITRLRLKIPGDDDVIRAISQCNHLVALSFDTVVYELTDASLPYIGQLSDLEELYLPRRLSCITAHGLEDFFENARFSLRELYLDCMSQERAESGDQAVRALIARNPKLQLLELRFRNECFQVSCAGFDQINSLHGLNHFGLELHSGDFHTATFLSNFQPKMLTMLSFLRFENHDRSNRIRRTQINQFRTTFPKCEFLFGDSFDVIEDEPPIDFSNSDEDEDGGADGDDTDQAGDPEFDGGANDNAPGFDHNSADHGIDDNNSNAQGQDFPTAGLDELSGQEGEQDQDDNSAGFDDFSGCDFDSSEKVPKTVQGPLFDDDSSDLTCLNYNVNDPDGLLMEMPDEFGVPTYGAKRGTTDEAFNPGQTRGSMTGWNQEVESGGKSGDPIPRGVRMASGLSSGVATGLGPCLEREAAAKELIADAKPDSTRGQEKVGSVEAESNAAKDTT